MSNLTQKQEKFCLEYIKTGNASEAYRQSYDCSNMQAKTINERSCRLLKECKISARIAELKKTVEQKIKKKFDIEITDIFNELVKIGFSDIKDYISWDDSGLTIKDSEKLKDTKVIESIQMGRNGVKFKLYNKLDALKTLGQHLGMFETNSSVDELPEINTIRDLDDGRI